MAYQQQAKTVKFLPFKERRDEYKSKDILVVEDDGRKVSLKMRSGWVELMEKGLL